MHIPAGPPTRYDMLDDLNLEYWLCAWLLAPA